MRVHGMIAAGCLLFAVACGNTPEPAEPRQYELKGQILAVRPDRNEVVIQHEDIENFMPAMTMPFKVRDVQLLADKQPGDLVTATLVVEEQDGQIDPYLSSVTTTGHQEIETAPPAETPDVLQKGDAVEDAPLVDQDGRPRPISSFRGHRVALTFIYTRCPLPEFCPLMDRHFSTVQKEVKGDPGLADVRLVTVTFDPEFDRPAILKAHASRRQADPEIWSFLTGEPEAIREFASQFGIYSEVNPQRPADIVHNLRTAVIDGTGRLAAVHSGNSWTPAELVADLEAAPAAAN